MWSLGAGGVHGALSVSPMAQGSPAPLCASLAGTELCTVPCGATGSVCGSDIVQKTCVLIILLSLLLLTRPIHPSVVSHSGRLESLHSSLKHDIALLSGTSLAGPALPGPPGGGAVTVPPRAASPTALTGGGLVLSPGHLCPRVPGLEGDSRCRSPAHGEEPS